MKTYKLTLDLQYFAGEKTEKASPENGTTPVKKVRLRNQPI